MKKTVSIIILLIILLVPSVIFADTYTFDVNVKGYCNYTAAYEILRLTNEHRAENGLPALNMDKTLLEFAMQRAAENAIHYGHTRPDNTKWYTEYPYIKASTGTPYGAKAENIAYGQTNAQSVFNAWKNSSGHNENMLSSEAKSIGIGAFCQPDTGKWMWVQVFSKINYPHFDTSGIPTRTFSVHVSTDVISFVIYSPDLSYMYYSRIGLHDDICPGTTAEYALASKNGYYFCGLDPSSYTITKQSGNISVNDGLVTGISEGPFSIRFNFKNGVSLISNEMTVSAHTYDHDSGMTQEPTCTEDGYSSSPCTKCGYIDENAIIPALGHDIRILEYVPATCTQPGLTEGKICDRCGEILTAQSPVPPSGHDFAPFIPDDALAGATYEKCVCCGEIIVNDPYRKLNDEIKEIYDSSVTEDDRTRITEIMDIYNSSDEDIRARFTNCHLLTKMLAILDGTVGDVNCDGEANAVDATQILRYANNKSSCINSERIMAIADVNGDGNVNAADATQILRFVNGKASVLDKYYN